MPHKNAGREGMMEDARAWADADPYVAAAVYAAVTVKPFLKVRP